MGGRDRNGDITHNIWLHPESKVSGHNGMAVWKTYLPVIEIAVRSTTEPAWRARCRGFHLVEKLVFHDMVADNENEHWFSVNTVSIWNKVWNEAQNVANIQPVTSLFVTTVGTLPAPSNSTKDEFLLFTVLYNSTQDRGFFNKSSAVKYGQQSRKAVLTHDI